MLIEELIQKYNHIHRAIVARGRRNKIIFILLLLLAVGYAYTKFLYGHKYRDLRKAISESDAVYLYIGIAIFCILLALLLKSTLFISNKQSRMLKRAFKKDLFEYMRQDIPELVEYNSCGKIHQSVFFASGLFIKENADYQGDDWLKGVYGNVKFEMCELHVFKMFRSIFSGIFVRCKMEFPNCSTIASINQHHPTLGACIDAFQEHHHATICISNIDGNTYLAVGLNGYFFENNNLDAIAKIEGDTAMLKDLVGLIKVMADSEK